MRLLDDHNGGVYQLAERDCDSGERHDVGTDSQQPKWNERCQHDRWHRHDGDSRAWEMPQEDQDDQYYGDDHLKNGDLQIADRTLDEFRTVINRNDLDAIRKARRDVGNLLLHAADHVHGVLAAPHDRKAPNPFSLAIQVGKTTPEFRPFHNLANILYANGRA